MQPTLRLLPAAGVALLLLIAAPATAATIIVDSLEDRSDRRVCSLRSAVEAAHIDQQVGGCRGGAKGADTIGFRTGLTGAIRLAFPLYIRSDLSIEGPGTDRLAITGSVVSIETDGRSEVDLSDLTMQTGLLIRSVRRVGIRSLRFENVYSQMSHASAIQIQGSHLGAVESVEIADSDFYGNRNSDSVVTVTGRLERLSIESSNFLGNRADLSGAILLNGTGPLLARIEDSYFAGNQALSGLGGAIAAIGDARLELARNHFRANRGQESGALFIAADRLRIENSVFHRNGAPNTGAIHIVELTGASGDSQLLFSTLVDNDSAGYGPALVNQASNPLWLAGNLLRPGNAFASCDPQGLASTGYNLELDAASCHLGGAGDMGYVRMMLYRISGGSAASSVPVPDPHHWAAVDAVPAYACSDLYGRPLEDDFLARTRPIDFMSGQPGFDCDVGAVELRASDATMPTP